MLYLVATPIGNLSDITLRALDTLREVDLVASEDTRKTGLLLKHFNISKPQISFHEYNEQQAGERIEALLKQGKSVAVVTNAGTPGISDPGFTLVRRALSANIDVTMIPGPTAFVVALVLSGLPVHSFTFVVLLRASRSAGANSWRLTKTHLTPSSSTKAPIASMPSSGMLLKRLATGKLR